MRICSYGLMPNHWHFVLWPEHDGDLPAFMQPALTVTHVAGSGTADRLATGMCTRVSFKSFPIGTDDHFYQVVRYVERNALRANLVQRAELWRWSSLWRRVCGTAEQRRLLSDLAALPCPHGATGKLVNRPQTEAELEAIRRSVTRGRPYGEGAWIEKCAERLGLDFTLRPRGRPRIGK